MTDPGNGRAGPAPAAVGTALAVLSAGTFGTAGVFASALISAGWSPAAAAIARLGGAALLLTIPAVVQLRGRWGLLRREAGRVMFFGLVAMAGNQLCYFNAIRSIPIGLAVLLEYLGVVLVVGWLWAVRGQRPGWLTAAGAVTARMAAAGEQVLPPLVLAWTGLGTGAATSAGSCRWPDWRWSRR